MLPLLRADPILTLVWVNNELRVQATAFAGYWYSLETSTNLQTWTVFTTHIAENDTFTFPETIPIDAGPRFYRVRLAP